MLVKDLKKLLQTPEGLTEEEFDNIMVMFNNGDQFLTPDIEESGYVIFGESCDKDGNPVNDNHGDIPAFILTYDLAGEEVEE